MPTTKRNWISYAGAGLALLGLLYQYEMSSLAREREWGELREKVRQLEVKDNYLHGAFAVPKGE